MMMMMMMMMILETSFPASHLNGAKNDLPNQSLGCYQQNTTQECSTDKQGHLCKGIMKELLFLPIIFLVEWGVKHCTLRQSLNCVVVNVFAAGELRSWDFERRRSQPGELCVCQHPSHKCSSGRLPDAGRAKQTSSGKYL